MATFLNPKLWKKNEAYQIGEIVISEGEIWQSCLAVPAGKDLEAPYWTQVYAEEGGGGDSDFTTATVTLQAGVDFFASMRMYFAGAYSDESDASSGVLAYTENTSEEFTAILYKGKAYAYTDMEYISVAATGSVEYVPEANGYIITGDCMFTFTDEAQ